MTFRVSSTMFACLAIVLATATLAAAENWAVLVAGSSGYYNYRHQADVCHAFHVLSDPDKGNIPKENIIVFMFDDIANNPQNPFKDNIINHPNGTNLYPGMNKDYTGADVTPANFLAVLSGNQSAVSGGNGKVLQTNEGDNIFVFFSDHGAPGLIAFPSDFLYADDLMTTLKQMSVGNRFNQLVFYLEACESGSMFEGKLPENIKIFATTASTASQSSYACYYDASRGTYLGDEFSVRWMEDSDAQVSKKAHWTLEQQYRLVAMQTIQSQPQQYGSLNIAAEVIEDFQSSFGKNISYSATWSSPNGVTPCGDPVDSRNVKLKTLLNRLQHTQDAQLRTQIQDELQEELQHRGHVDYIFDAFIEKIAGARYKNYMKATHRVPQNFECLKQTVAQFERTCGRFSDYSLKWIYVLVNFCEEGIAMDHILENIERVCSE